MTIIDSAIDLIKFHEGCTLVAKPDAKGKWEIGWGHDITAPDDPNHPPTCTQEQADAWLEQDCDIASEAVDNKLSRRAYNATSPARYAALVDMAYELGASGLSGFHKMLEAIESGDWEEASRQALDSLWARQVPKRAAMDADMLLTGQWPVV